MDRKYYLSGLGEVIATALPRDYKGKSIRVYVAEEGVCTSHRRPQKCQSIIHFKDGKPNRTEGLSRAYRIFHWLR